MTKHTQNVINNAVRRGLQTSAMAQAFAAALSKVPKDLGIPEPKGQSKEKQS